MGECGLDSSGSGLKPVAGSFQHSNKSSPSINAETFLPSEAIISFLKGTQVLEVS
jgi:hypothetical protein